MRDVLDHRGRRENSPWTLGSRAVRSPWPAQTQRSRRLPVVRGDAAEWNATALQRWGKLRDAVYSQARRRFGKVQVVVLAGVWQRQERGLLHAHIVVGFDNGGHALDIVTFYRRQMCKLLGAYGFSEGRHGFHSGRTDRYSARDASRYLAPYLKPDDGSLAETVADIEYYAGRNPDGTRRGEQCSRPSAASSSTGYANRPSSRRSVTPSTTAGSIASTVEAEPPCAPSGD